MGVAFDHKITNTKTLSNNRQGHFFRPENSCLYLEMIFLVIFPSIVSPAGISENIGMTFVFLFLLAIIIHDLSST